MAESPDFKELLRTFNDKKIEFLIVGGYAVMKFTEPRFTKELDVWIRIPRERHQGVRGVGRIWRAAAEGWTSSSGFRQ